MTILRNIKSLLLSNKIKLNLVVGLHFDLEEYFKTEISHLDLTPVYGSNIKIISAVDKPKYFKKCCKIYSETDVLWTKPSEMSFYAGLGIPLIMSAPIGTHEYSNRKWVINNGGGMEQKKVQYFDYWFFDSIKSGKFAEMAWDGYVNFPTMGVYNIEKIVSRKLDYDDIKMINDFLDLD